LVGGFDLAAAAPAVTGDEPSAAFLDRERRRGAVLKDELAALTWRQKLKRLRQLEQENGRLKKMVADRELEIDVLKEITRKKW